MRPTTAASMVILIPLALAACSSTGAKPAPAPTAKAVMSGINGTQLKTTLVTHVPSDYTINKAATVDSGATLQPPTAGPTKGVSACGDLNATAFIQVSGKSGIGFAQNDYLDPQQNEISQEVDSFASVADATAAMTALKAFFVQCAKFSQRQGGHTFAVKLVTSPAGGLGVGAFKGVMTSTDWVGGSTLVVAQQGACLITAFASTQASDHGATVLAIAAKIRQNLVAIG